MHTLANRDVWTIINQFPYRSRYRARAEQETKGGTFVVFDKNQQLIRASDRIEAEYLLRVIFTGDKKYIRETLRHLGNRYIPDTVILDLIKYELPMETFAYVLKFWNSRNTDDQYRKSHNSYSTDIHYLKHEIIFYVFGSRDYQAVKKIPYFLRIFYENNYKFSYNPAYIYSEDLGRTETALPLVKWQYKNIQEIRADFNMETYQPKKLAWTSNPNASAFVMTHIKQASNAGDIELLRWLDKKYTLAESSLSIPELLKKVRITSEEVFVYLKERNFFVDSKEELKFPLNIYVKIDNGDVRFMQWVLKYYGEGRFKYTSKIFWKAVEYGNTEMLKLLYASDKTTTDAVLTKLDIRGLGSYVIYKLLCELTENTEVCDVLKELSGKDNITEMLIDSLFENPTEDSATIVKTIITRSVYSGKVLLLNLILNRRGVYHLKLKIKFDEFLYGVTSRMVNYAKYRRLSKKYRYRVMAALRLVCHSGLKLSGRKLDLDRLKFYMDLVWVVIANPNMRSFLDNFRRSMRILSTQIYKVSIE